MPSFVDSRHPIFQDKINSWEFFQQSYDGGEDYITKDNIFRHSREDSEDYQNRLDRAVFLNHCQPVIDTYTGFIFGSQKRITRPTPNDNDFEAFLKDSDLQGSSLEDKMQMVAKQAQIKGHVGILVDMPNPDVEIISLADRQALNIRPYLVCYEAENIVNWAVDSFGRFKWVRLRQVVRDDDDPFSDDYQPETFYQTWTRTEWFIHDEKSELVSQGAHNLGVVPFVSCRFQPKTAMTGQSHIKDIARINRMLVNLVSCIDEFAMKQAFPFLAAQESLASPEDEDLTISQTNLYSYPEGGQPPSYISPPTDTATFLLAFVKEYLVSEILRHANLESRVLMEQSGTAKLMDFQQTNAVVTAFARQLEQTENQINAIFTRWLQKEAFEPVDYPDTFEIQSLESELENQQKISELYIEHSPTVVAESLKRLKSRILPKLEAEVQQAIDGELDESVVVESQARVFNQALAEAA